MDIKLTPEGYMDSKILFLIRINGEELAYVDTEKDAKSMIDSIATVEQKSLENEWVKVFRQDVNDGRKTIISTQSIGRLVNGNVTASVTIDYIPVGHAYIVKN